MGYALAALGRFPSGTNFKLVDDIDKCALLIADGYGSYPDVYDERYFHVAAWHGDLIELADHGYITGLRGVTEREWEERKRDRLRSDLRRGRPFDESGDPLDNLWIQMKDGELKRVELPPLSNYDDDDEEFDYIAYRSWLGVIEGEEISVTPRGFDKLEELWRDGLEIPKSIDRRIRYLLEGELYDSALRDLGALAETRMRELSSKSSYGQQLVGEFIEYASGLRLYVNADIKVLRSELRTAFKFLRNEYAHKIVDLPKGRAYALVSLMCDIIRQLDEFKRDLSAREASE